jgi:hypothetical protein
MRPSYDWEVAYVGALLEPDVSKLKARIDAAQSAIDRRLQEMNADHGGSPGERYAIETAQAALGVLRKHDPVPRLDSSTDRAG